MSIVNIIGSLNLKINDRSVRKVSGIIGIYFFVWLILQFIFWGIIGIIDFWIGVNYFFTAGYDQFFGYLPPTWTGYMNLSPLIHGFTLFGFLPYWFRIVLLVYLLIGVVSMIFTVLAYFSMEGSSSEQDVQEYWRSRLIINCVECRSEIHPPGEWLTGETDIRCKRCDALMTLTIESGKFKKLTLKQTSMYS